MVSDNIVNAGSQGSSQTSDSETVSKTGSLHANTQENTSGLPALIRDVGDKTDWRGINYFFI